MRGIGFIKPNSKPYLIGVAGGSGSGKTYFAESLQAHLGSDQCAIVFQDSFYIDQSSRFDFDGGSVNFDHPDAIDFTLLAQKLAELKAGSESNLPIYDFKTHSRQTACQRMSAKPVIIVDGILIFHSEEVRRLFDDLIFFDSEEEIRFQRRLKRDVNERGRSPEGVRNQFYKQVKPMHDRFVEPSKKYARRIVRDQEDFRVLLEEYCRRLSGF